MRRAKMHVPFLVVAAAYLFVACHATAQEPPRVELLPRPRVSDADAAARDQFWFHDAYYRRSRYEVWDYYGVDRSGRFRPRVAYQPYGGSFYLVNGEAFPWVSIYPQEFMPYVFETP
jgi:hypothetical protein